MLVLVEQSVIFARMKVMVSLSLILLAVLKGQVLAFWTQNLVS